MSDNTAIVILWALCLLAIPLFAFVSGDDSHDKLIASCINKGEITLKGAVFDCKPKGQ